MYHRRFDDVGDGSLPDWVQPFTEGLRDEEPGNEVALARTPSASDGVGGNSEQSLEKAKR